MGGTLWRNSTQEEGCTAHLFVHTCEGRHPPCNAIALHCPSTAQAAFPEAQLHVACWHPQWLTPARATNGTAIESHSTGLLNVPGCLECCCCCSMC
jgi:hypothetical protein